MVAGTLIGYGIAGVSENKITVTPRVSSDTTHMYSTLYVHGNLVIDGVAIKASHK